MRFASLGSGSEGNALVVQASGSTVMIDCGFGIRETVARCARLGLDVAAIDAIVITHEHGDHVGGAPRLARRFDIPVWLTFGTLAATESRWDGCTLRGFDSHDAFVVGEIEVQPFPVPHDAREPAQMTVTDGERRLGILTDVGESTPFIEASLADCDALFLEANHCETMLAHSRYPAGLKARIAGRFGHLSNRASSDLLRAIAGPKLQHIVAAHLSRENNTAILAQTAFAEALGAAVGDVKVATQDFGLEWVDIA
ncbi:MAG TPA: MBL fold metallo-hydrolase [Casimicrobium sp.]|nr:MBL fold metallo-hydrolase [Burkholderiales bacterium]HPT57462.1 MBL fold metallo-hydrolase [Casimicrobium sp.]